MKRITLKLFGQTWYARFDDEPNIADLMGGEWVPTPFTNYTRPSDVCAAIQKRNPQHDVQVSGQQGQWRLA